jgi:hypothetical protein
MCNKTFHINKEKLTPIKSRLNQIMKKGGGDIFKISFNNKNH